MFEDLWNFFIIILDNPILWYPFGFLIIIVVVLIGKNHNKKEIEKDRKKLEKFKENYEKEKMKIF